MSKASGAMQIHEEISTTKTEPATAVDRNSLSSELKSLLEQAYGVEFTILDGATGEVMQVLPSQPSRNWDLCDQLCRAVASRGRPEFINDEEPFLTLALPFLDDAGTSTVAVADFLTRPVEPGENFDAQAGLLGMRGDELAAWAAKQTPWTAESLKRVSDIVFDGALINRRLREARREADSLSVNLASTYEEISLLYRLTQNLKLSKGDEDLGRVALDLYRQQSELLAGIVRALTSAIDAKDPYTRGHSDRVARVAVRIAEELGCDPESLNTFYLAGLLHDIGKIGIDDNVLHKAGKLSDSEYEHIKQHVGIGHKILQDLAKLEGVLPVVLYHHESWDGRGYPHQLESNDIPLPARIVAVADAFDAMTSDRPYRKGMSDDRVDDILREGAGRQWDPKIIDAFFRVRDDIRRICREENESVEVKMA